MSEDADNPAPASAIMGDRGTDTLAFTVEATDAGARLDAYLATRVAEASRTRLKQLIEDGEVLVSGRAAKPSSKLRAGDQIELETPAAPLSDLIPENIPLKIVFEDESLVVVNKPAGLVVHPAAGVHTGTLANALAFHFQQLSGRAGALRPGIVHRIDRDTSGLLVVAKTEQAHEDLANQFRARQVFKSYIALTHGAVREEGGSVEQPLARDARNRTRMAVVRGGRPAFSLYRVRRRYDRLTLLDVEIKTGRTHQIRVHLEWLKHPIVGDKVYGGGRDGAVQDTRLRAAIAALDRQFLHAERLGFWRPRTGEWMKFQAPLPIELSSFLELVENN